MARAKTGNSLNSEPSGLWHQPTLMHLLADTLIVLAIVGLGWAAASSLKHLPIFPVREVKIAGEPQRVSAEQIAHVARTGISGNFFTLDLDVLRAAVEQLPWVRSATVRRIWPDGIEITLQEHDAVAIWRPHNGETGLINGKGEVFHAEPPEQSHPLPRFNGPTGRAEDILLRHREFSQTLSGIGRTIDTISLSPRGAWRFRLDDGLIVELGRDQEGLSLSERTQRLAAHYENLKLQMGSIRLADLRYPNGFALSASLRPAATMDATGRNS